MIAPLHIHVLGELSVLRDGRPVAMPPSRKTRALLAFLALAARPCRRERLCEVFWDLPDDPRGALRWSLSKIRGILDDAGLRRVAADRERASLALDESEVDLRAIRQALQAGGPDPGLPALRAMAEALARPLLDGLDLPSSDIWQAWLVAEREDAARLRPLAWERIALHPGTGAAEAVRWARAWATEDPVSATAAALLARTLRHAGRPGDADAAEIGFRRAAAEAGLPATPGLPSPPPAPPPALASPSLVPPALVPDASAAAFPHRQAIGFCKTSDGTRIAHATVGAGPPLVKAANWLNHLELDWQSPIWSRTFQALATRRTLIRYDERGNGLSDWDVPEISLQAFVRDLEAVVDALGLARFPLLGMSQGCAVSIDYAVRHPERVSALILIGGYAAGWRIGATPEERERREATMTLTRLGWGTGNAAYRHIFSQTFMPNGTPEDLAWFDEFQRRTTSPENAVRFQDAFGDIDVRDRLALVRAPTLVMHAIGDQRIPLAQGRELAIGIPGARFKALDSRSHIILGHEPAWPLLMGEIERFLGEQGL